MSRYWFVLLLILGGIGLSLWAYFLGPTGPSVEVELRQGQTLPSFADTLKAKGVIESPALFLFLVKSTGHQKQVSAGFYTFKKGEHEWRAARRLAQSPSRKAEARITIPEGKTGNEIAGMVSSVIGTDSVAFANALRSKPLISELAKDYPYLRGLKTLEGFLFPDTYDFYRHEKPEKIIRTMVARHFEFWDQQRLARAHDLKMTVPQVVILASIVEKEAGNDNERPLVASVFLNRLARGMPLASNSTIGYALGKNAAWLTGKDLSIDSPFNTYKHKGLPPTPICSPGIASIDAVLNPAKTDYLFFVATGDGKHLFARTYQEHQRNVKKVRNKWK